MANPRKDKIPYTIWLDEKEEDVLIGELNFLECDSEIIRLSEEIDSANRIKKMMLNIYKRGDFEKK